MSYDIAVWEGPLPASDSEAAATFAMLVDAAPDGQPVADSIRALVSRLTTRWPEDDDSSPWSTGPLIGEARGAFIHIPMTYSGAAQGVTAIANEAARLGLVCFDPQDEAMLN